MFERECKFQDRSCMLRDVVQKLCRGVRSQTVFLAIAGTMGGRVSALAASGKHSKDLEDVAGKRDPRRRRQQQGGVREDIRISTHLHIKPRSNALFTGPKRG